MTLLAIIGFLYLGSGLAILWATFEDGELIRSIAVLPLIEMLRVVPLLICIVVGVWLFWPLLFFRKWNT